MHIGSTPSWTSQKDFALGSLGQMFSGIQLKNVGKYVLMMKVFMLVRTVDSKSERRVVEHLLEAVKKQNLKGFL